MTKISPLLFPAFALFILLTTQAHADIYRCVDSLGRSITSDRPMPECKDKSTQVYRNDGVLKDKLSGTLTPEQRRAAELQEQQRAQEALQQEQGKKEKRYLTAHYPTEQDIEVARQRALDAVDAKISEEKNTLKTANEVLNKNQSERSGSRKSQSNEAFGVSKTPEEEEELKLTVQRSTKLIQRYLAEKTGINNRFDEIHKRYLEVVVPDTK